MPPKSPNWMALRQKRIEQVRKAATERKPHDLVAPFRTRRKWEIVHDMDTSFSKETIRRSVAMACREFDIPKNKRKRIQTTYAYLRAIERSPKLFNVGIGAKKMLQKMKVRLYDILREDYAPFLKRCDEIEHTLFHEVD